MLVRHLILDNIFERNIIIGRKFLCTERECTIIGQRSDFMNAVYTVNEVCFCEIMVF